MQDCPQKLIFKNCTVNTYSRYNNLSSLYIILKHIYTFSYTYIQTRICTYISNGWFWIDYLHFIIHYYYEIYSLSFFIFLLINNFNYLIDKLSLKRIGFCEHFEPKVLVAASHQITRLRLE